MDLYTSSPLTYSFNYNIDQVYKCFISFNINRFLRQKGLLSGLDYIPENFCENDVHKNEILLDKLQSNIIRKLPCGYFKIKIERGENTKSFKQFKFKYIEFNRKPLKKVFNVVFSFYENTENNSTFASFEIECSKSVKNWVELYSVIFPISHRIEVCKDFEKYLQNWNNSGFLMDSILIQENFLTLFERIIDGTMFIKLPYFQSFSLTTKRADSIIGSSFILEKKGRKIEYVVKKIEKTSDLITLYMKKFTKGNFSNSSIKMMFFKLDDNLSMFQSYSKFTLSLDGYYYNIFKEKNKKILAGMKSFFETSNTL